MMKTVHFGDICVASACSVFSNDLWQLIWIEEEGDVEKTLCWVPHANLYTRQEAQLFYDEEDVGPSEEVMVEIGLYFVMSLSAQLWMIGAMRNA